MTLNLFYVEDHKSEKFIKQFIYWFPGFCVFTFFPAMQSGVGTDYETYFNYFYNNEHTLYLNKNEIIYYYVVELTKFIGDPQFQFILISVVQGLLFFYLLFLLKSEGYKSWLIFIIYFLCTGMYHNQMNGLRQFICVYIVPISVIFIYKNKFLNFSFFSFFSFFVHSSSLFSSFFVITLSRLRKYFIGKKILLLILFILSFGFYLVDFKKIIIYFLEFFNLRFLSYVDTKYAEGRDILGLLTKFYYLPIIILFWFFYLRNTKNSRFLNSEINDFFILIFSLTYFMFLQALSFDLMLRIWGYFNFFIIFPIYYVFVRCTKFSFALILIYILIFYLAKVLFFPVAEYEYFFYKDWF